MQCIICNEHVELNSNYYFCNNCKIIFKDRKMLISEDAEESRYMLHNNSYDENYAKYFRTFIEESIIPNVDGKVGLDYGSGVCNVLEQVMEKEYDFEIDSYDKYFCKNPDLKNQYDFITCTEVIEHIKDPLEFLYEMDKYLKRNGTLIIMTKFHPNSFESFFNWWYIRDVTHITFYTFETFEYLAKLINYSIVSSNGTDVIILKKN